MKRVLLGIFISCFLAGCGYTTHAFVAQTGYKTIYVAPFINQVDTTTEYNEGKNFRTYYPLLENTITNAVIDRYIFDGSLRVVKEKDADLVLTGDLTDYRRESLRTNDNDTTEEFRITLFVHIKLVDRKTEKVVWEYTDFAGDSSYFTTGSFVKSEAQALSDATTDLARRIVEATVEAW